MVEVLPLVAIEALALGRPVIAWRSGGMPEQIEHGVNGYLVGNLQELMDAFLSIDRIRPQDCRASAEGKFNVERMVDEYLVLYERVLGGETWNGATPADAERASMVRGPRHRADNRFAVSRRTQTPRVPAQTRIGSAPQRQYNPLQANRKQSRREDSPRRTGAKCDTDHEVDMSG